ncbi:hypothetical protein QQG55_3840 [Brugia pahangi]
MCEINGKAYGRLYAIISGESSDFIVKCDGKKDQQQVPKNKENCLLNVNTRDSINVKTEANKGNSREQ